MKRSAKICIRACVFRQLHNSKRAVIANPHTLEEMFIPQRTGNCCQTFAELRIGSASDHDQISSWTDPAAACNDIARRHT